MPMPVPKDGESEDAFMDRCMGADGMVEEFPESDQRAAVCHKQFRGNAAPPVVNVTAKVRMMRESRQRREFAFSVQVNAAELRVDKIDGREFKVFPAVMLNEGVLRSVSSPGPELVLSEEFGKVVEGWNGRPITAGHPQRDDDFVSAGRPDVFNREQMGFVFNSRMDGDKLRSEMWIDVDKAKKSDGGLEILRRMEAGERVEISTGYFMDLESAQGEFRGAKYEGIQRNFVPDHLAVLGDVEKGACSWEMGCGVRVNAAKEGKWGKDKPAGSLRDEEDGALMKAYRMVKGLFTGNINDMDLRTALQIALDKEAESGENQTRAFRFIIAVEGEFVVYEEDFRKLMKRGFKMGKDGKVVLGKEVQEVRPETNFIAVNQAASPSAEERKEMDKAGVVSKIIASKVNKFEEKDRAVLMSLNEEVLQKIEEASPAAPETVGGPAPSDPAAPEKKEEPPVIANKGPQTAEEYVKAAPEGVRDFLAGGLEMLKRHREAMVKAITSNSANKFTEAELKKMGTDDLEKISALLGDAVPEVNYSGRGIHRVPALNVSEEAIPEPPSVFKLLQEKANGAAAAAK